MKSFPQLRLALALTLALFAAGSARAAITVLDYWRMGEHDTNAVSGRQCTNTFDAVGGDTLTNTTAGGLYPIYTNGVSAMASADTGSTLALSLTNDQYGTATVATSATDNFGVECWVKPDAATGGHVLVLNGIRSTGWGLYLGGTNFEVIYGAIAFYDSVPASTNAWTHLALVRNGGIATLYTNGVQAGTNFNAAPNTPSGSLTVGGDASFPGEGFTGLIDEVRVFTFTAGQFSTNDLLLNSTNLFVSNTNDNGAGSLRDAVAYAPNNADITFAPNLSGQTITLTNGQIEVSNNVTIDASALANGIQINGNNQSRIFQVDSGSSLSLNRLTLSNGNSVGVAYDNYGGAIQNSGNLSLTGCTLMSNSAVTEGGAIENDFGTLTLTNCTLFGNSAYYAGAIGNASLNLDGLVTLSCCTLSGNSCLHGGGAMDNYNDGVLTLTGCIIAGNTDSSGTAPDLWMVNGSLTANNCLIGNGMNSTLVNGMNGNKVGTSGAPINALLAPLGNYGGPTQTMPPLAGSPAIDAGIVIAGLTTDQRGYPRTQNGLIDIGAVEVNPNTIVTTNTDNGAAGSLRHVVASTTNTDLISFAPNLSGQTILLTNGQIELSNNVTIDASALPGGIAINGNASSRVFQVDGGVTAVLNSLTITNGSDEDGGGIYNTANLTVNQCTLAGNFARNVGGGIGNMATLVVNQSTLTANSAPNNGAGGIFSAGNLTLNQCTVVGNSAGAAGGIFNYPGYSMTINNSIIAENVGGDTIGSFTQTGVNLVGGNPMLAPLGNYGGPTPTMPPLPGSPAIDAGAATTFTTDQRGFPRVVGPAPDIGAVESGNAIPGFVPVVTTNSDAFYSIGAGAVSLREAVAFVTGNSPITFATSMSGQTIVLTNGELLLDKNQLIYGLALANGIQISGNHSSRIFNITTNGATLTGLTLINANGGGADGGALLNAGNTFLYFCTFTGNSTGSGGAIKNATGSLMLNECTLYGNSTTGGGGGGIVNYAVLSLSCSTLTGNSAGSFGGALYSETGGYVTLDNSIVAGNTANDIYNNGTLILTDTNIVQSISGSHTGTTPINASPQLAAPGNYGGPTPTMPPLPGSPAIDAGDDSETNIFTTDQRGYPRLAGAHVDIGAVEGIYNAAGPGTLTNVTRLGNGSIQFGFTNYTDANFPVLATTNVSLPLSSWTRIGFATNNPAGSDNYQFTDPQAATNRMRFYRVVSP